MQCLLLNNENPVFPHSSSAAMAMVPVVTGERCLMLKKNPGNHQGSSNGISKSKNKQREKKNSEKLPVDLLDCCCFNHIETYNMLTQNCGTDLFAACSLKLCPPPVCHP